MHQNYNGPSQRKQSKCESPTHTYYVCPLLNLKQKFTMSLARIMAQPHLTVCTRFFPCTIITFQGYI